MRRMEKNEISLDLIYNIRILSFSQRMRKTGLRSIHLWMEYNFMQCKLIISFVWKNFYISWKIVNFLCNWCKQIKGQKGATNFADDIARIHAEAVNQDCEPPVSQSSL